MTPNSKPCRKCGAETTLTTLPSFHGEEGPVVVTVDGMPARVCTNGHKRFLFPEFVARLMDLVSDAEAVAPQPPAHKRGLFRKHFHCSACDAELPATPEGHTERELDASIQGAEPFKAAVRVDLHRCAKCSREQVLSNEQVAISAFKALTHGFRAADVHVDA